MGFNAKLFEVMLYEDSFDVNALDSKIADAPGIRDYAYIRHDMDGGKIHWHVALRTTDTRNSDNVASWFGVPSNLVGRVHGRWSDVLRYLTHENAPDKYQYSSDKVTSNFDWQKVIADGKASKRVDEIVNAIIEGNIREYNYFEHISGVEYVKYKRQIDGAFAYRLDKLRGVNRLMEAVFITGDSGVGKTTYAKEIAKNKGFSVFVSSGSNDVLDGYAGQECIILDDLRPACLGLADLLKLLDNHTASSVRSRYKNKVLECQLIVITSTLSIDTFFRHVFAEEAETVVQLKRRCGTYIEMETEIMKVYVYDRMLRDYDMPFIIENPVRGLFEFERMSRKEQFQFVKELLGSDVKVLPVEKSGKYVQELFNAKVVDMYKKGG